MPATSHASASSAAFTPSAAPAAGAPAATAGACTPAAVPLASLRGGDTGRLHTAQLACEDCDLLNAMGLTDQCEIRVCRGGEPCIVQVSGTRLGLSSALAQRILITRSPRSATSPSAART